MSTEVCPIRNPEVWRLVAQAEPLRQDRLALQRLIARYGGEVRLDQALARARIRMEGLSEEYEALKARGEAL